MIYSHVVPWSDCSTVLCRTRSEGHFFGLWLKEQGKHISSPLVFDHGLKDLWKVLTTCTTIVEWSGLESSDHGMKWQDTITTDVKQ